MSALSFIGWLICGYIVLALSSIVVGIVADSIVIPFILWLHRVGVLKAKP